MVINNPNLTFDQKVEEISKLNKDMPAKKKFYISRTKLGYCKNNGCDKQRRPKSAYCGECK